jgi:tetratricopeptide (TPR) repeat protein
MFTSGAESVDEIQKRIQQILTLHREGHSAEGITGSSGWELSQVKSVLMSSNEALSFELAKLLEQAEGLRCAYSKRLVFQPLRGPEGIVYERRVLEEWMRTNNTWPNSSTPIQAPLAEVDREVKEQVKQFSLRALEVVQNCIQRNARREAAVSLAAECLGVLNANSNLNEFLGVLLDCNRDGQAAILASFKPFRPSLLRKLLLSVAPIPNLCRLTLVLAEVLEETQLNSKKLDAKAFISTLQRKWQERTQSELSALMMVVLGRLHAKTNGREQAEDCLQKAKSGQAPAETELSEFYGGLGDLHFDLNLYALAKVSYGEAINKSKDPQSLRRVQLRLEQIQEIENRVQSRRIEEAKHEEAKLKVQARDSRAQGNSELADLYDEAVSHLINAEQLARTFSKIGLHYWFKTDIPKSEEYYLKCLNIRQEVLPAFNLELAETFKDLGDIYVAKQDFTRAEEHYLKCLRIYQEVLPAKHLNLATIFDHLGEVARARREHSRAEGYYLKSLSICQEVLPSNDLNIAAISLKLGLVCWNKRDYIRSEEYYLKVLRIRQAVLPAKHPDLAETYKDVGEIYQFKRDHLRTEEYFLKCLSIWQEVLPANHPNLAKIYSNLGCLYEMKGDDTRAEEYFMKCLIILQQILPAKHPDTSTILIKLGVLYWSRGDNLVAEEYFRLAN